MTLPTFFHTFLNVMLWNILPSLSAELLSSLLVVIVIIIYLFICTD